MTRRRTPRPSRLAVFLARAIGVIALAITLIITLIGVWGPHPAHGNPIDAFGYGARANAMAGAQTAAADDTSANYYNPAILATFDGIHVDIGYQLAVPTLLVGGLDTEVDSARGFTTGLVVPGYIKGRKLAIAMSTYLPDQHMNRIRTLSSQKPRFVVYDNRPQRLFIASSLALQITERLYAGVGMAVMSSSKGVVQLDGRVGFPNADDSDLDLAIDVDFLGVRYPQAGLWYQAAPWLQLGVSYRGGFTLILDQTFRIDGDVGAAAEPLVEDGYFALSTVSRDLFQPAQFTFGLDAQLTPRLSLAFDVGYHRWSAFENPAARIELDLDIGDFNDLVDIPTDQPELPASNFNDIVIPRLALEWTARDSRHTRLTVRGGYAYEASPVPWQFGETNFIDNDKHTVSIGSGLVLRDVTDILPRPMSIDLSLALTALVPRDHLKISAIDPVGSYRSTGRIVQGAISTRWDF